MALHYPKHNVNYINLHRITKLATPEMFSMYKLALLLFKVYNDYWPNDEWIQLNVNHILPRDKHFLEQTQTINLLVGQMR